MKFASRLVRLTLLGLSPWLLSRAGAAEPSPGDASKLLAETRSLLLSDYVDEKLSNTTLDLAAVQGMVTQLNGGKADGPNALLDDKAMAEMQGDLKGELVGVGMLIDMPENTELVQVVGVLPGSAAAKAGLQRGDRLISIDGQELRGRALRDIAGSIRGREGTAVRLGLLRGTQLLDKTLTRQRLTFPSLDQASYGDLGVLTIRLFNERTPAELRTALEALAKARVRRLLIDLRGNGGGLFEKCISSAELLLPRGAEIVRTVGRGGKLTVYNSKAAPILARAPIAVLVDGHTASSAEVLAEALRVSAGATLVGSKTFGKWRMETMRPLPGGYTLKYTIALIQSPQGKSYDGKGLIPDVEVAPTPTELEQARRLPGLDERLQVDPQLKAAVHLLRLRG